MIHLWKSDKTKENDFGLLQAVNCGKVNILENGWEFGLF